MKRRRITSTLAAGLILAAAAAMAAMAWLELREAHEAVRRAAGDLEDCRRLAAEMAEFDKLPAFAVLEPESPRELVDHVQAASQQASLPPEALVRIEPQAWQRPGDGPYRIRPTRLELRNVTLPQAASFAWHLSDSSRGLTVRDLRLSSEQREGSPRGAVETWTAEVTLTQLVFSPTTR